MSEPWNEYAIGSQEVDKLLKGYWEHWWITVKKEHYPQQSSHDAIHDGGLQLLHSVPFQCKI